MKNKTLFYLSDMPSNVKDIFYDRFDTYGKGSISTYDMDDYPEDDERYLITKWLLENGATGDEVFIKVD